MSRNADLFVGLSDALARNRANRTSKRCSVCRETKPITEYYKGGSTADGHGSVCKPCAIKRSKDWHEKNRNHDVPTVEAKECPACRRYLSVGNFHRSAHSKSGLQTYCAECQIRLASGETVADIAESHGHTYVRGRQDFGRPRR